MYDKPELGIQFKRDLTTMEPEMIQLGFLDFIYRPEKKINFVFAAILFCRISLLADKWEVSTFRKRGILKPGLTTAIPGTMVVTTGTVRSLRLPLRAIATVRIG